MKSIQQAQQRSSLLAKTLSVGVLLPRKTGVSAQKGFRTHKGFNVDSELEGQLVKIRSELEGTGEIKRHPQKLNHLGRLPNPSKGKDSQASVEDQQVDEANKTQGGFEVIFLNPRASQEYTSDSLALSKPLGVQGHSHNKQGKTPTSHRPSAESHKNTLMSRQTVVSEQTDGFVMELTGLEACVVKLVWEDFSPPVGDRDELGEESIGEGGQQVGGLGMRTSQANKVAEDSDKDLDEDGRVLTSSTNNTGMGEVIIEDLVSLKKGQIMRKQYSFESLGAKNRKGIKFILSLLADDGSCISSMIVANSGSGEIEDPISQDEDFLMRNTIVDCIKYRCTRSFAKST